MVRPGYKEVARLIASGPQDSSWVAQEMGSINLGDKRLDKRLVKTAESLARSPLSPINEACGDWAGTRGAYRLFDNGKAKPQEILKPHFDETIKRIVAYQGPVLAIQDTVFFSYGTHLRTRGLGPIGKTNNCCDRGLVMHSAHAFTTSGLPIGILSEHIWAREDVPIEERQEKIERLQCTPIEEKESFKWLVAMRETVERVPSGIDVITIADRESDIFEFIADAEDQTTLYLIRARTDRKLVPEDSEGCGSILEAITAAPVIGTMKVAVPGNGKRKPRTATVEVRIAHVTIKPPKRRGKAKKQADLPDLEPIPVQVISATETCPPKGEEAISWILLTNLPVTNYSEAVEKLGWYCKRWGIEVWHKVLKSGCKVEECLLETADRLERFLTLFSIIGYRLLYITHLARTNPDAPASDAFSEEELEALQIRVNKQKPDKDKCPKVREVVRMLGHLGGHLGRKCDGEPGITVLWRGIMRLNESIEMLCAHKAVLGIGDTG